MMIPGNGFAGLSIMTVAESLQLPLVRGKLTFPQFSDKGSIKHLLDLQSWHLFEYTELTEVVRQNNKLFNNLFKKIDLVALMMM